MKLTFCWAAKIVTGSCYLIETKHTGTDTTKFLIDCGMFQWPKEIMRLNYEPFLFDPKEIDFVLLTHAHIDHSGLIPKLYKQWFRGKIYATAATIDLCDILFEDSAEIQEKNIEQENNRRQQQHLPPRFPLYTPEEAKACMQAFIPVNYQETYPITDHIHVRFQDAGHIIWSASIELFVTENNITKKLVFSWDIGQRNTPIIQDPTLIQEADYLFMESTYGDRVHENSEDKESLLTKYIQETYSKWGKLLIPSFSVERTQELLYFFNMIIQKGNFPPQKIFLDSPLSIKATEIFKKRTEYFDTETQQKYPHPFDFDELICTKNIEDSQILNTYAQPCIIIAGNGMCTAGRITHHIRHHIDQKSTTLLFVGYQAEGTLGKYILQWAKTIRLMGIEVAVHADIAMIDSFSGHADKDQLRRRAKGFTTIPKMTYIVHGELPAQTALQEQLEQIGFACHIPGLWEHIEC